MPHYSYEHTFTAGTDNTHQEELEMPCAWGKLTDVAISFPAGCHGVAHVHLDQELHQIFPTNPEETYSLDDYTILIQDEFELLESTRKIYLRGWNEGTYDHTIKVAFTVIPFERMTAAEQAILQILNIIKRIFRIK